MLNVKSALKLFDIMINANTCHKMNALGQRMLHECFAESELFANGVHNVTYMYSCICTCMCTWYLFTFIANVIGF